MRGWRAGGPRAGAELPPPFAFQVQHLQGVYSLQEQHFWTLCSDVYVGTLKLVVAPDADARWILSQTHNIFTQV